MPRFSGFRLVAVACAAHTLAAWLKHYPQAIGPADHHGLDEDPPQVPPEGESWRKTMIEHPGQWAYPHPVRNRVMRIYLDVCCYNRHFDDQTQDRIRLETEAVTAILARADHGEWELVGSTVHQMEVREMPDTER
jgi:hypothetical protein